MSIPPVIPKAPEVKGTKRPAAEGEESTRRRKEQRLHVEAQEARPAPTPQNFNSTLYPANATHVATPLAIASQNRPMTLSTPPTLPTTPITNNAINPYSRLIMPYPTYYSPHPYYHHMATFYNHTPPTQWRTPSHLLISGSSAQNQNSNFPPGDSIHP